MQEDSLQKLAVPDTDEQSLFIVSASKETAHFVGKALLDLGFQHPVYPFQPTTGLVMTLDSGNIPSLLLVDYLENKEAVKAMVLILKQHMVYKKIPLIMMVAPKDDDAISQAYDMGANATMVHPDFREEFYRSIFSAIGFWFKTAQLPAKDMDALY